MLSSLVAVGWGLPHSVRDEWLSSLCLETSRDGGHPQLRKGKTFHWRIVLTFCNLAPSTPGWAKLGNLSLQESLCIPAAHLGQVQAPLPQQKLGHPKLQQDTFFQPPPFLVHVDNCRQSRDCEKRKSKERCQFWASPSLPRPTRRQDAVFKDPRSINYDTGGTGKPSKAPLWVPSELFKGVLMSARRRRQTSPNFITVLFLSPLLTYSYVLDCKRTNLKTEFWF